MPVIVLCPQCGTATPFHAPPVEVCPRCQAILPDAVTEPADRALAAEQAPMPFLLELGRFGTILVGGVPVLMLIAAGFGVGSFSVNAQAVSSSEFLRDTGLLLAGFGGYTLAIAVGLWRERAWARPLMLWFWVLGIAVAVGELALGESTVFDSATLTLQSAVALGIAGWYLYDKRNVVAYYRRLEKAEAARAAPRA